MQLDFSLQAQKEDFARQVITALRVVLAQCPALLEPIPTSQVSQCVPAVLQDITAQKKLEILTSSLVPLVSTAQMVYPPETQSFTCFHMFKSVE